MPGDQTTSDSQRPLPMVLFALARPGSPLLPSTWPTDDSPQPLTGRRFSGLIDVRHEPFTAYNVVAIVRGTDYRMNKTYVAFGAHTPFRAVRLARRRRKGVAGLRIFHGPSYGADRLDRRPAQCRHDRPARR